MANHNSFHLILISIFIFNCHATIFGTLYIPGNTTFQMCNSPSAPSGWSNINDLCGTGGADLTKDVKIDFFFSFFLFENSIY